MTKGPALHTPKSALWKTRALWLPLVVFVLALLGRAAGAAAQSAPAIQPPARGEGLRFLRDPGAAIAITADQLIEDRRRQRIIGRGDSDIRYLGNRIQADYIEVQTSTRDGVATGNVIFHSGEDRLTASRVEFNLDTERMVIFDARGFIGATHYVTGQVVRRLSEDRYEVQEGTFTTCEGDLPDWAFGFRSAIFQVEGYARLQSPVMTVKGAPAAFLPWAIAPIKTKRATGFLVPDVGYSSRSGLLFSPSFFWAINEWSDATLGVDYFSKRGARYRGEYRYAPSRNTSGEIAGQYLEDRLEGATFEDVKGVHRTDFGAGARLHAVLDMEKRPAKDSSLESDLAARTRQRTDSHVTFQQDLPRISGQLQIGARREEGLNESDGQVFEKAPEIVLDIHQKRLGASDLYFKMNSSLVHFRKTEDDKTARLSRFHAEPSLSLRMESLPWLQVTPEIGLRTTYWTHQKAHRGVARVPAPDQLIEDGLGRDMWFAQLHTVGPRFSRIYQGALGPFRDFKHIVSLETTYRYSPPNDAEDRRLVVPFDSVDTRQDENAIEYALVNRVLTKLPQKDGHETRQLLRYEIRQTYNVDEDRRTQRLSTRPRRPFSDITFKLVSEPTSWFRLLQEVKYNPYDSEVSEHATDLFVHSGQDWYLSVDRTWKRQRNAFPKSEGSSSVNFAGGFSINQRLFLEYITRLNDTEEATIERSISARYRDCCWAMELTYTALEDQKDIFFGFSLLGVFEAERAPRFRSERSIWRGSMFSGGDMRKSRPGAIRPSR